MSKGTVTRKVNTKAVSVAKILEYVVFTQIKLSVGTTKKADWCQYSYDNSDNGVQHKIFDRVCYEEEIWFLLCFYP